VREGNGEAASSSFAVPIHQHPSPSKAGENMKLTILDYPPAGWFVLDVLRNRKQEWLF
jgi:hypothetical protein